MYNLFLVDDEPFILDGLKALIPCEEMNLQIVGQAINGVAALEKMKSIYVDILITDIKMPKMDGLTLISEVKKLNPQCKFIILSGFNDFEYVKEGIKLGIENYLTKPINTEELILTLQNCITKFENSIDPAAISMETKDWDILRTNIMNRWMNQTISHDELQNRSELLLICIDSTCYNVAIINIKQKVLKPDLHNEIFRLCYKMTIDDFDIICYEDLDGDFVLVFSNQQSEYRMDYIQSLLISIHDKIKEDYNINTHITLGTTVESYKTAPESYRNAKDLLEYYLIYTNKKLLTYEDIEQIKDDISLNVRLEPNTINSFITDKDTTKLYNYIDDIFNKAKSTPGVTPTHIRNLAVEFVIYVSKISTSNGNLLSDNYTELLSHFLEINDLSFFKDQIKYLCNEAIQQIEELNTSQNPVIQQILQYIHSNYAEDLSLKTLGYEFNINSTYLGQLFKKETGESFPNYLNIYRIEKAKQLMLSTNLKNSQISKKVGYQDPNYYYRIFKKYIGMSPAKFKTLNI